MSVKACIFDLNGIIVDLDAAIYSCWKDLSSKLGYELSSKQFLKLKPLNAKESLDRILKWNYTRISEAEKQQMLSDLNKQFLNLIDEMTPEDVVDGFKDFNQKLRAKGVKVAVATLASHAIRIIDRLDLVLDFDAIVDGRMLSGEPNCENLLKAVVDKLHVDPQDCSYISRSREGSEAAGRIGINLGFPNEKSKQLSTISNWNNAKIEDVLEIS